MVGPVVRGSTAIKWSQDATLSLSGFRQDHLVGATHFLRRLGRGFIYFAAVIYIRNCYVDGGVVVRQVKAANKLTPKKTISVPKLG